jgi:hypothetical protein
MPHRSEDHKPAMVVAVNEKLGELLRADASSLTALPPQSSEKIEIGKERFTLSVWHDEPAPSEHRIVVQAHKSSLFGMAGKMYAEGLSVKNGEKRRLSGSELDDFT